MKSKINILFIAYYFEPSLKVGAQRVSYWAKNFCALMPQASCDVITSSPYKSIQYTGIRNIYFVEDSKKSLWSFFIKDEGVTWGNKLKYFFSKHKNQLKYDFVIMTGGPFMHFALSQYIKNLFDCKIILDFRDPFADNPRFDNILLKKWVKIWFEQRFIIQSDYVITVNEYCKERLWYDKKLWIDIAVIENGFDEEIAQSIIAEECPDNNKIQIVYAGSIYDDRNPCNFLNVITRKPFSEKFIFHHIGKESEQMTPYKNMENIIEHGIKSYSETLQQIKDADAGIIFTSGFPFESTTKVFDYIGMDKPIIIITRQQVKTGTLHSITKDYKVYWAKDNETDIKEMLGKIQNDDLAVFFKEKMKYSRLEGLKKLVTIIQSSDD